MGDELSRFQADFLDRLYHGDDRDPPGLRVYRNTVLKGCVDALAGNYPAVLALVGEAWFRAAAVIYARNTPPDEGRLFAYGAGFARFLAEFEPAAELPYLPAVAALDRFWCEAHTAADAAPAKASLLATLDGEALRALRLTPHPAARWGFYAGVPAYALWRANRYREAMPATLNWNGEGALLTRPGGEVRHRPLSAAGVVLLDACAEGLTLAEAASRSLASNPDADLSGLVADLLTAGAWRRPRFSA